MRAWNFRHHRPTIQTPGYLEAHFPGSACHCPWAWVDKPTGGPVTPPSPGRHTGRNAAQRWQIEQRLRLRPETATVDNFFS